MKNRVILINSLSSGGAEKVVSILISELNKKNINIELICLENNVFYQLPRNIKVTYLSNFNSSESRVQKLFNLLIFAYKLKCYIKNNSIDIVQSHLFRANYVNALARVFGAKHKVQMVTAGRISRYKEEGLLGKINLLFIKYLYPKADLLLVKSESMLNDMLKLFPFSNETLVINNPYEVEKIQQLKEESVVDFYFEDKKKYIISVGRLIALKRNEDLLRSVSKMSNDIEVIFLGEGNQKVFLENLAKELNIENRIHFLGVVSNPYKYMSKADIFVSTSSSEGFPNVLVEAMICELPIISSDCVSGPREILAPNTDVNLTLKDDIEFAEYGILFPVGSVNLLIRSIETILQNKKLNNKYATKGIDRALDYHVDIIVKKYMKVFGVAS